MPNIGHGRLLSMIYNYQLAADDYVAFARYLARPGGESSKQLRLSRLMLPVVILISVIPDLLGRRGLTGLDAVFLLIGVGWYLYLPTQFANGFAKRVRARAKSGMPRGAIGTHEMVIDESGVTVNTAFGSVHRHWTGVESLVEAPAHFLVMYGTSDAFIVPKSWLGESTDEFRDAFHRAKSESPVISQ